MGFIFIGLPYIFLLGIESKDWLFTVWLGACDSCLVKWCS